MVAVNKCDKYESTRNLLENVSNLAKVPRGVQFPYMEHKFMFSIFYLKVNINLQDTENLCRMLQKSKEVIYLSAEK